MRVSTACGMRSRAAAENMKVSPQGVRRCLYGRRFSLRPLPACEGAGGRQLSSGQDGKAGQVATRSAFLQAGQEGQNTAGAA